MHAGFASPAALRKPEQECKLHGNDIKQEIPGTQINK